MRFAPYLAPTVAIMSNGTEKGCGPETFSTLKATPSIQALYQIHRNLRKDRSLTLKQMAKRTGLSVSLLSQIERAESSASISSLYKIAVALDARIQDLFGEF